MRIFVANWRLFRADMLAMPTGVRLLLAGGVSVIAAIVVLALFLAVGSLRLAAQPPALVYDASTYPAVPPTGCPGQTVAFSPTLQVNAAPVVLAVVETWFSYDTGRTAIDSSGRVLFDQVVDYGIVEPGDYDVRTVRRRAIIPDVAPGRYRLRRAVTGTTEAGPTGGAFYGVDVQVTHCGGRP